MKVKDLLKALEGVSGDTPIHICADHGQSYESAEDFEEVYLAFFDGGGGFIIEPEELEDYDPDEYEKVLLIQS